jgi:hypothetical protein
MLIKNGQRLYDEYDVRAYAKGYWDGRYHGEKLCVADGLVGANVKYSYDAGFAHGMADYTTDEPSEVVIDAELHALVQNFIHNTPKYDD